ncbi:MAG TPA: ABC transporter permease [Bdellovibrionota bacterium]|nr:ABC transporter permease [Bdellovibrionota bacterium]
MEKKDPYQKGRAWKKFKKHKLALAASGVLVALYLCTVFAEFIAPYSVLGEDRISSYQPPNHIYFFDGGRIAPHIYNYTSGFDANFNRVFYEQRDKKYYLKFFNRGDKYKLFGFLESNIHLFGTEQGGRFFLMGADARGRDLFSRVLFGSRVSLSIGLVGSFITFFLGMLIGAIAGYYGGWVDGFIMRLCEILMMVPGFYLLLALRAALPAELPSFEIYMGIVIILSFISWAGLARVIRGMVLSEAKKEYVLGAQSIGVSSMVIIMRHILPNTLSYVIVSLTVGIPGYILGESALSLLGLGIVDPDVSWGNMLSAAMQISHIQYHPWILIPGFFILITVMMFNLMGDGLRDAFDPRS